MAILLRIPKFSRNHDFIKNGAIKLKNSWILDLTPMPNSASMIKEITVSDLNGEFKFDENFSYDIIKNDLTLSRNSWKILKDVIRPGDRITIIQEDFGPELIKPENKKSRIYSGDVEIIDSCGEFWRCEEMVKRGFMEAKTDLKNFGYKNPDLYQHKRILMIKFKGQDQPILMSFSDRETKYTICL